MASLADRNGTKYADFHDASRSPKRKRFSLKTKSRKVARRLLSDLEDAYAAGRWDPWLDSLEDFHDRPMRALTLGEARALYLEHKRGADLSKHTIKLYRYNLDGLTEAVGDGQAIERLTAAQVRRYTRSDDVAKSTQNTRHNVIKSFFKWLRKRGHLEAEPMKLMEPPKEKDRLPRALRPTMLEKMISELQKDYERKAADTRGEGRCKHGDLLWHAKVWRFAVASGLRLRELARLRHGHVDRKRGIIELERQKSGKAGTAPLSGEAARILDEIGAANPEEYIFRAPDGDRFERSDDAWANSVTCMFARYRKAAGLPDRITFHSTRHAFCVLLAEAGKNAYVIKEAARHSSVEVSQRYVKLAGRKLRDEVNDVFG